VVLFTYPVQAVAVGFQIWQSPGVKASGSVTFTRHGEAVGGPWAVSCDGTSRDYRLSATHEPNDISWSIRIDWSGACEDPAHKSPPQPPWTGTNQPWPGEYEKTHSHSPEEWKVGFRYITPAVGVPEFPLGSAMYIAAIPLLLYIWWKRKQKILHAEFLPFSLFVCARYSYSMKT